MTIGTLMSRDLCYHGYKTVSRHISGFIAYHSDGCDKETLALINDYFSAPNTKDESGSSDSEGLALVPEF